MTAVINLNKELILQQLKEGQYTECTQVLKDEFKLVRNEENKPTPKPPSEESLELLGTILEKITPEIDNKYEDDQLLLAQQCFQSLRNSSACGKSIQNLIAKNEKIIANTSILLIFLLEKNSDSHKSCSKMLLQFLSNLTVNNSITQAVILDKCFNSFNVALFNIEISHIVALIFYNCLKSNVKEDFDFKNILINVLKLLSLEIENIILILEILVEKNFITNIYKELESEDKVSLLECISVMLTQETIVLPLDFLKLMSEQFKRGSDCILKTVTNYLDSVEPLEVARLLDCLATCSSSEHYLPEMQKDKSLLINCAFLLRSIHNAGKEGDNDFTAIQKLSELKLQDSKVENHPAFGFKAALIRILGNLAWKHEENQNMVRELECIQLLMDCCNIDARNPLIIQWVIFSIRNLCENNDTNKQLIASMTKVGVVDSATLREMGLALNDDGANKICIAPLNLNK